MSVHFVHKSRLIMVAKTKMSEGKSLKYSLLTMIEECRSIKKAADDGFLDYQSRVELELTTFLKEIKDTQSHFNEVQQESLDTSLDYSKEFIEDGTDSQSFVGSVSCGTSSAIKELNDYESSLYDNDSQETAMNHYQVFQDRKSIQRRIRFNRTNNLRARTLAKLGALYKDIGSSVTVIE